MGNARLLAFRSLPADPYYGSRLAAIPEKHQRMMVQRLEETAAMNADEYAIYVRNLFLDDVNKPRCWGAIDEIMSVCGSMAAKKERV